PAEIARLRAAGFTTVALTPRGDVELGELGSLRPRPERIALVIGGEAGIGDPVLRASGLPGPLPMAAGAGPPDPPAPAPPPRRRARHRAPRLAPAVLTSARRDAPYCCHDRAVGPELQPAVARRSPVLRVTLGARAELHAGRRRSEQAHAVPLAVEFLVDMAP